MLVTTVLVSCDYVDEDEGCEAEFEVIRDSFPMNLHAIVNKQLQLRGWSGTTQTNVTCPLHQ